MVRLSLHGQSFDDVYQVNSRAPETPLDALNNRLPCVSMMSGNIAVFGGNGLTGSEVVYQALERGDTVTAFCRDPSKLQVPVIVRYTAVYCLVSLLPTRVPTSRVFVGQMESRGFLVVSRVFGERFSWGTDRLP